MSEKLKKQKANFRPLVMSYDEYDNAQSDYCGYCKNCEKITHESGVEPDARNYKCDTCGKKTLFGIEEAALNGWIEVSDEE